VSVCVLFTVGEFQHNVFECNNRLLVVLLKL